MASQTENEMINQEYPEESRRSRRPIVIAAVLLVLAAAAAAVAIYLSGYSEVPDVQGKYYQEAYAIMQESGLELREGEYGFSDDIDKNCIIKQSPAAGERVRKGTVITADISKGAVIHSPDIVGMTSDKGQKIVLDLELLFDVAEEQYSDDIKKGVIMSQEPQAGTDLEEGDTVTVIVSKGKVQVKVPDVTGMDRDDGVKALEKAGLKAETTEEYSDTVESGSIIEQSIAKDKETDKGSTVTITVSKGAEPKAQTQTPAPRSGASSGSTGSGSGSSGSGSGGSDSSSGGGWVVE